MEDKTPLESEQKLLPEYTPEALEDKFIDSVLKQQEYEQNLPSPEEMDDKFCLEAGNDLHQLMYKARKICQAYMGHPSSAKAEDLYGKVVQLQTYMLDQSIEL